MVVRQSSIKGRIWDTEQCQSQWTCQWCQCLDGTCSNWHQYLTAPEVGMLINQGHVWVIRTVETELRLSLVHRGRVWVIAMVILPMSRIRQMVSVGGSRRGRLVPDSTWVSNKWVFASGFWWTMERRLGHCCSIRILSVLGQMQRWNAAR